MLYVIMFGILVFVDQLTKILSLEYLTHKGVTLIEGVLSLSFVRNTGAAWGIFAGKTFFLVLITVVIFGVGFMYFYKNPPKNAIYKTAIMLVASGGIGNMIDRIFRDGSVIDMIKVDFIDFPVFNVADICVCVGAVLLCIAILFFDKEKDEETDDGE